MKLDRRIFLHILKHLLERFLEIDARKTVDRHQDFQSSDLRTLAKLKSRIEGCDVIDRHRDRGILPKQLREMLRVRHDHDGPPGILLDHLKIYTTTKSVAGKGQHQLLFCKRLKHDRIMLWI